MPIGITEEHEALHQAVRGWAEPALPAGSAALAPRRRHGGPAAVLGRPRRPGLDGHSHRRGARRRGVRAPRAGRRARGARSCRRPRSVRSRPRSRRVVLQAAGKEVAAAAASPISPSGSVVGTVALDGALDAEKTERRCSACAAPCVRCCRVTSRQLLIARRRGRWCVLRAGEFDCHGAGQRRPDPARRRGDRRGRARAVCAASCPELSSLDGAATSRRCCSPPTRSAASQWCVDTAAEYAKDRRQFGRPIGQFQGVKHRCANMLARTELARAATWDAARAVDDAETEAVRCGRCGVARDRRVLPDREGLRADPRWDRLHVGARRARLPPPCHGDARPARAAGGVAGARRPARARRVHAGA